MSRSVMLAAVLAALSSASAVSAQEYSLGRYDARGILNWAFAGGELGTANPPTWTYTGGDPDAPGIYCSIVVESAPYSLAEYDEYFDQMTPAVFAAEMSSPGQPIQVLDLSFLSVFDRRVMRAGLRSSIRNGEQTISIGNVNYTIPGDGELMTVTCGGLADSLFANRRRFDYFFENLDITLPLPR
jgi:hypothetical protein